MAGLALRMEPYNPDAVDADGDGIVQEWTPWERPGGTRLLDEVGNAIEKGAVLAQRPKGLKIVDSDGKHVNYTPTYSGGALGAGIAAGGAGKPSVKKPDAKPTPLAEHGAPSLREMGLQSVRSLSDPKPELPPPPVVTNEDDGKKSRWTLLEKVFGKELWLGTDSKGKKLPASEVRKSRLQAALSKWRSSFGNSYAITEAATSDFDPDYVESHIAKALIGAIGEAPVRQFSVRVDSRQFEVGQTVDFPLISTGSSSEIVSGYEAFNDVLGASEGRGVYLEFRNAPSLPHMVGDKVDDREFILSGEFRVVSVEDYAPRWENDRGRLVALRGKRKRIVLEYVGPSKEVRVDGRSDEKMPVPESFDVDGLKTASLTQLSKRFGGDTGAALAELDTLLERFKTSSVGSRIRSDEEAVALIAQIQDIRSRLVVSDWDDERGGFRMINDLWEQIGYAGSARTVSPDEFSDLQEQAGHTLYRGVKNHDDDFEPSKNKSARDIIIQLWEGDLHQGNGVYGQGTYFAGSSEVVFDPETQALVPEIDSVQSRIDAIDHAGQYGFLVTQAVLAPDARTVTHEQLGEWRAEITAALEQHLAVLEKDLKGIIESTGVDVGLRKQLISEVQGALEDAAVVPVFDMGVTASLLGYDAISTTGNNWNVLNRTKLVSDKSFDRVSKMKERVEKSRADRIEARIKARNAEILGSIAEAGGSLNNVDQDWADTHREVLENAYFPVLTKEQALERQSGAVSELLGGIRSYLRTGEIPKPDSFQPEYSTIEGFRRQHIDSLDPELQQMILELTDEEIIDILRQQAVAFRDGLSGQSVRVRIKEHSLLPILEGGRYLTTHETTSMASAPNVRKPYETSIGYPPDLAPSLRPASGYIVHPDWEEGARERHRALTGHEPDENTWLDAFAGSLGEYGDIDLILNPAVSERISFGAGDSLNTRLHPTRLVADPDALPDDNDVLLALISGHFKERDRIGTQVLGLLESYRTGSFKNLNLVGNSANPNFGLDEENTTVRQYFEAMIPGSFSADEISEVRIPFRRLSAETSVSDSPTATQEAVAMVGEMVARAKQPNSGIPAALVTLIEAEIKDFRWGTYGNPVPRVYVSELMENQIRLNIAERKMKELEAKGIKVRILYEGGTPKLRIGDESTYPDMDDVYKRFWDAVAAKAARAAEPEEELQFG